MRSHCGPLLRRHLSPPAACIYNHGGPSESPLSLGGMAGAGILTCWASGGCSVPLEAPKGALADPQGPLVPPHPAKGIRCPRRTQGSLLRFWSFVPPLSFRLTPGQTLLPGNPFPLRPSRMSHDIIATNTEICTGGVSRGPHGPPSTNHPRGLPTQGHQFCDPGRVWVCRPLSPSIFDLRPFGW